MKPYPHQEEGANEALSIIKKYGIVYIAWEERCGKTLTSILTVEKSKANRCLVVTKKKALDGWIDTLEAYKPKKLYTVTNYHDLYRQIKVQKKIKGKWESVTEQHLKAIYRPENFDVVILDESHAYLSAYPKTGAIAKIVQQICYDKPVIFLSATPAAQGHQLLFHQLNMSKYSPFDSFANFYRFFDAYGIPEVVYTGHGQKIKYDKVKPIVWDRVKHLFIFKTRAELDFEHEPEDVIHYVELEQFTKDWYNECQLEELMTVQGASGKLEIPLDSSMKLRTTLHMLEGGVFKAENESGSLHNIEKIRAIKHDFGDSPDMVIMYHYKAEGLKLQKYFKHAQILQGTSFAEGVDLSHVANLIIYSQDFSTAKHSQRRARQANKQRREPIRVHFYLVKDAISDQVYTTVSINKTNFVDRMYKRKELC